MTKKILFVATSSSQKGDLDEPTGVWLEELAAPYNHFMAQGYEVTIASIKGGEIPVDPGSLQEPFKTEEVDKFMANEVAMAAIKNSVAVESVSVGGFDAVFVPGGLGVMYDMPDHIPLGKVLSEAWAQGKVVSAVCHGPGALLGGKTASGEALVKGKNVTGFTNTEEEATGNTKKVPYLLEDKLKEQGGMFSKADDWTPYAVRDGRLITGQNPASSKRVAELVQEALI